MKPTTVKFFKENQLLIIVLIILVLYGSLYTAFGQVITKKVNDQVLMFTNVQPIRPITQVSTVSNSQVSTVTNTSNITISPQQPLSGPGGGDSPPVGGGGFGGGGAP